MIRGTGFVVTFTALFWPTFSWMGERFSAPDSFYSHGWLIPMASGWLIWRRREALRAIPKSPSFKGVALLLACLGVHLAATDLRLGFVSGLAMVGTVWGWVWTVWGGRTLVALRLPLLFLLFMVPVPGILLIYASFKMKLFAAGLAANLLPFLGIPTVQAGSTLQVPGVNIVVDDTCSGLRSLISLIALSTLWTALMPPGSGRWQRWTLIAASIPIALGANLVRILGIVVLAVVYGPQAAEGFIHYGSGVVVFGCALAALLALSHGMQKWSPSFGNLPRSLSSP